MFETHELQGYAELNCTLLESIYAHRLSNPGASRRSCVGGWHSSPREPQIVTRPGFDRLVALIHQKLPAQAQLHALWATVNPKGAFNGPHAHTETVWSCVYYVKVPTPVAALVMHEGSYPTRVEPKAGQLLVFDGSLRHSVEPNLADEDRVSIACDWAAR